MHIDRTPCCIYVRLIHGYYKAHCHLITVLHTSLKTQQSETRDRHMVPRLVLLVILITMAHYRTRLPMNFLKSNWDTWKCSFMTFRLVTELRKKSGDIQVASLKYCMGPES